MVIIAFVSVHILCFSSYAASQYAQLQLQLLGGGALAKSGEAQTIAAINQLGRDIMMQNATFIKNISSYINQHQENTKNELQNLMGNINLNTNAKCSELKTVYNNLLIKLQSLPTFQTFHQALNGLATETNATSNYNNLLNQVKLLATASSLATLQGQITAALGSSPSQTLQSLITPLATETNATSNYNQIMAKLQNISPTDFSGIINQIKPLATETNATSNYNNLLNQVKLLATASSVATLQGQITAALGSSPSQTLQSLITPLATETNATSNYNQIMAKLQNIAPTDFSGIINQIKPLATETNATNNYNNLLNQVKPLATETNATNNYNNLLNQVKLLATASSLATLQGQITAALGSSPSQTLQSLITPLATETNATSNYNNLLNQVKSLATETNATNNYNNLLNQIKSLATETNATNNYNNLLNQMKPLATETNATSNYNNLLNQVKSLATETNATNNYNNLLNQVKPLATETNASTHYNNLVNCMNTIQQQINSLNSAVNTINATVNTINTNVTNIWNKIQNATQIKW